MIISSIALRKSLPPSSALHKPVEMCTNSGLPFTPVHITSCSAHCALPWRKKQRKTVQNIHRKVPREDIYGGRRAVFACDTTEPVSITVCIAISSGQAKATKLTAVYTAHINTQAEYDGHTQQYT